MPIWDAPNRAIAPPIQAMLLLMMCYNLQRNLLWYHKLLQAQTIAMHPSF